jgi:DNA-binding MarR family transcriptional regulator
MTRPAEDSAPNPEDVAQLAELLVRTSRRLRRSSMAELGPMGLTGAQARVVRYLVAVGHPARMADIAAALEVVPRTATSVVDDLEAAKLVARATDPRDRRSVLVSLTDEGVLLLDRIAQARRRTAEATFSALSPKQRGELTRLLTVCCGPNERCGSGGPQPRPAHSRRGH